MKALRICRAYLWQYRTWIVLALLAMMVQTAMDLLAPWPLKIIFDSVLGRRALPHPLAVLLGRLFDPHALGAVHILDLMVAVMVLVGMIDALFTFAGGLLTRSIGQRVIFELRVRIFDHIQRLSISFHKNSRVGDLSARLTSDIQSIQDMVSTGLNSLVTNVMTVLGVLLVVALIDVRFAVLMLCATPLLLVVGTSYQRRIRQASRRVRKIEGQIGATAQEKISAIQVVQAFANEDEEARLFAQQTRNSLNAGLAVSWLQSELSPLVDLVGVMSLGAILWLGARAALAHQLTAGDLILFITYLRSILNPVRNLSKLSSQFSKSDAAVERIQEVLDIEPDVQDLPGARRAPRLRGEVDFENVWFGYDAQAPVLRDVSLRAEPGQMVALVGATGSGKSSLLSLISRFHDPQHGRVTIDSIDVRRFTLRSLRDQIGLVLQDPVLFSGTIRDNIAYGLPGVSDVEILRAAKMANVHEFVARLPDGYATMIGERGGTLSGGQRQRISIARAIVRRAPILLLDEPTSGLDAESEALVMQALQRLMQGRTTFVVAHRLSTVERADLILVLDGGTIREQGTHQQLLRKRGIYARLHELQFAHG